MRLHLLALGTLTLAACSDRPPSTGPAATSPRLAIADARDYKAGFYWLPPIVKQPAFAGVFDAGLAPVVEICELDGEECASSLATYTTTTGPGGEIVGLDVDDQHYHVNWHTDEFLLNPDELYRVSVRAGGSSVLLGYADVQPVSNGSGLRDVDSDEYIGLVDGRTLPIKFRIETGIVGDVLVEPAEAAKEPGETQQFVASVTDLHGSPVSATVSWESSDRDVATVDQTGLATAVATGNATITATVERVAGSATLTVVDFGACSPFRPFAWYPLDNHGDDASGNGIHGTPVGAFGTTNRNGVPLAAMSFDGIDDVIDIGDRLNTLVVPFSVAAWVYEPASSLGDFHTIFSSDDHVGRYFGVWLQVDPTGLATISYGSSGTPGPMSRRTLSTDEPIPTDQWVHLAGTVRGPTDMTFYVNGNVVAGTYSGTGGPLVHSSAPARIGHRTVSVDAPWQGGLDDLRIYACSLEHNGVAALLEQP